MNDYGWRPDIGDRKTFVPAAFEGEHQQSISTVRPGTDPRVTGEVVQINAAKRWFRVRWTQPDGSAAYECFKF